MFSFQTCVWILDIFSGFHTQNIVSLNPHLERLHNAIFCVWKSKKQNFILQTSLKLRRLFFIQVVHSTCKPFDLVWWSLLSSENKNKVHTVNVWNFNSWNPNLSEIQTFVISDFRHPYVSENQLLVQISDISQKRLKSKLFGNWTVIECLKSQTLTVRSTLSSLNITLQE